MMTQETIYAVVDFGSYEIRGMIAQKSEEGKVSPISYAVEPSGNAIRNGRIYNIDEATQKLRTILKQLNEDLPDNIEIKRLYAGVGAMSLATRSVSLTHRMEKEEGEEISQEHLDLLNQQIKEQHFDGYDVLSVPTPDYVVDGKQENHPKSILCKEFVAHYRPIIARSSVLRSVKTVIEDRLHLSLAGILINPLAEASVMLSDDEKTLGVAHVNIGAGCSSVAIYKNNLLKLLRVIPLGGRNVSKDLCALRLVYAEAEELKKSKASVLLDVDSKESVVVRSVDGFSERSLSQLEINRYAQARMQEITANIMRIVTEFDSSSRLSGGMVVSGGALQLKGYAREIQNEFSFVRMGNVRADKVEDNNVMAYQESLRTVVGLVALASENCVDVITQDLPELFETQPKEKRVTPLTKQPEVVEPSEEQPTSQDLFEQAKPQEKEVVKTGKSKSGLGSLWGSWKDMINGDLE